MACFVIGNALLFFDRHDTLFLFQASRHAFNRFVEVFHDDRLLVLPCRQQSGLVDQIREFRTAKTGADCGDLFQFHVRIQFHIFNMDLEDFFATANVGTVD